MFLLGSMLLVFFLCRYRVVPQAKWGGVSSSCGNTLLRITLTSTTGWHYCPAAWRWLLRAERYRWGATDIDVFIVELIVNRWQIQAKRRVCGTLDWQALSIHSLSSGFRTLCVDSADLTWCFSSLVSLLLRNNLVDPASSHMLVSKIKPCMSQYKLLNGETANGSLKQL